MKKLLVCVLALLVSGAMYGQQEKVKKDASHFFAFHAGPSVPVSSFGKTTITTSSGIFEDREAGFAQTGFTARVNYQYQVMKNFGIAAAAFYNNNKINSNKFLEELNRSISETGMTISGIKLDHWQWYGITAGPALTQNLSDNILADIRIMGGIANANSPKVSFEGTTIVTEDWSVAPVLGASADLRFNLKNNLFIIANAGYQYLRPNFTLESDIDGTTTTEKSQQKIEVFNISAGIGFRF